MAQPRAPRSEQGLGSPWPGAGGGGQAGGGGRVGGQGPGRPGPAQHRSAPAGRRCWCWSRLPRPGPWAAGSHAHWPQPRPRAGALSTPSAHPHDPHPARSPGPLLGGAATAGHGLVGPSEAHASHGLARCHPPAGAGDTCGRATGHGPGAHRLPTPPPTRAPHHLPFTGEPEREGGKAWSHSHVPAAQSHVRGPWPVVVPARGAPPPPRTRAPTACIYLR